MVYSYEKNFFHIGKRIGFLKVSLSTISYIILAQPLHGLKAINIWLVIHRGETLIMWITVRDGLSGSWRSVCHKHNNRNNCTYPVWFGSFLDPSGNKSKLKVMKTFPCNSDFWKEGRGWEQASWNWTWRNTSQVAINHTFIIIKSLLKQVVYIVPTHKVQVFPDYCTFVISLHVG